MNSHQHWQSYVFCVALAMIAGVTLHTAVHTNDLAKKYSCYCYSLSLFCFAAVSGKRGTEGKGL